MTDRLSVVLLLSITIARSQLHVGLWQDRVRDGRRRVRRLALHRRAAQRGIQRHRGRQLCQQYQR